ncbi:Transcription factor steA [Nosema granulosis]|uniref:Transcription factor steA n=1 Tax=Nosema granulosis TaxID=83296 RepID=A0A9P6GYK3_9MICR|nr:Transcription factor steA [Nosema granulosis]
MLNSDKELFEFLTNAPKEFRDGERIKKFQLKNGDFIHCVLWNMHFYITGTDIVKILIWRFQNAGRTLSTLKKFEEGIFSDLRNLKPGIDATLEGPRSEFLEFLYKNGCIRTQKKQKVFYWYSVPHDALFCDALERDLRRETNMYTYNKYMNNLARHNGGGFGAAFTRNNMKRLSVDYDNRYARSVESVNQRMALPRKNPMDTRNPLGMSNPMEARSNLDLRTTVEHMKNPLDINNTNRGQDPFQRQQFIQENTMKNHLNNRNFISSYSVKDQLFTDQSPHKVFPEYDLFEDDDLFNTEQSKQINPATIEKPIPENFSMQDFDFLRQRVEDRMKKEAKPKKESNNIINNNKNDNSGGFYNTF